MGPGFESLKVHHEVGVVNVQGTPVPIPNTEVKLCSADNTWLETAWEDRLALTYSIFLFLVSSVGRAHDC